MEIWRSTFLMKYELHKWKIISTQVFGWVKFFKCFILVSVYFVDSLLKSSMNASNVIIK